MHKYPFIILFIIILVAVYSVLFAGNDNLSSQNENNAPLPQSNEQQKNTDFTAAFLIFTHGLKRDFSASMYHNLSESVYITNQNPAIVHVKSPPVTWQDFFSTLPMGISPTCLTTGTGQLYCDGDNGMLRFFINGKEDPHVLESVINPMDKLLITFGNSTIATIEAQLLQIPDPSASSSAVNLQEEE